MLPKVPDNTPKYAYGAVVLQKVGSVLNMLNVLGRTPPLRTVYPLNMEQANHVNAISRRSSFSFLSAGTRRRLQILLESKESITHLLDAGNSNLLNAMSVAASLIMEKQVRC